MINQIFIQARIGSKRFPGKVLKKICAKTIIELIIERLEKVKNIDKIILVTGSIDKNKSLVDEARHLKLEYFCGNEDNVLDRMHKASQKYNPDNIVRITADCPLIDFNIINNGLEIFLKNNFDMLSNGRKRTFPHGYDFDIFKKTALKKAWEDNVKKFENIKVFHNTFIPPTKYIVEKKKFINHDLVNEIDLSGIRVTLDYPEDFEVIKKIYENLYEKNRLFGLEEVVKFLEANPHILDINRQHVLTDHGLSIEK